MPAAGRRKAELNAPPFPFCLLDDQDAHQVRLGRAVCAKWRPLCERRIGREGLSI